VHRKVGGERAASVETAAKISDARRRRGIAHGARRRRRRESVGSIRAFCASKGRQRAFRGPSPQNFFGLVNPPLQAVIAAAKACGGGARRARTQRSCAQRHTTKTRISSALLQREQIFFAHAYGGEIYRRAIFRNLRRIRAATAGRGAYTQN
jgi:hypothetical protein